MEISSGEGYLEASLSSVEDIIAGNGVWEKWTNGNVTVTTLQTLNPAVIGIRAVNVSGSIKIVVGSK